MCCELQSTPPLFQMVFHLDVHYSSGKVVAGEPAENAGNLHSYCPQELRTPTTDQSSERSRICAKGKPKSLIGFLIERSPPSGSPCQKDTLNENIEMYKNSSHGFLNSGPAWRYSDAQQCSVGATLSQCFGAVHRVLVYGGLGGGREEMCLSSDWHSGNRHS